MMRNAPTRRASGDQTARATPAIAVPPPPSRPCRTAIPPEQLRNLDRARTRWRAPVFVLVQHGAKHLPDEVARGGAVAVLLCPEAVPGGGAGHRGQDGNERAAPGFVPPGKLGAEHTLDLGSPGAPGHLEHPRKGGRERCLHDRRPPYRATRFEDAGP